MDTGTAKVGVNYHERALKHLRIQGAGNLGQRQMRRSKRYAKATADEHHHGVHRVA